ncbi:MAG: beta-ketoacyl-[acyl-carrier-protein] synthase family protein [Chitinivibrionales bacterium]
MQKKRVVVTGIGVVTPIGTGNKRFWEAALKGTNGIKELESIDTTDCRTKTGGEVKDFRPEDYLTESDIASMGRSSQFAIAASEMALNQSGLNIEKNPFRVGVSMGTTMGEPQILDKAVNMIYRDSDIDSIPSYLPSQYPCGVIPANISRKFNIKGPSTIIPTACAAGNYAAGYAYDQIRLGEIDAAVVGGSDPFSGIAFTGFNRLLSTTPDICRPFDKNRKGMAVSEGAGILILEELEHAKARGAEILAEFAGYGLGCDAFNMTIPHPQGEGGILATGKALKNSGTDKSDVDYICAHGTGTGENDKVETLISKEVFGDRAYNIPMTSLKSMLGHTMGAASAIEAAACVMMINEGIILPTINYSEKDPLCDLDYVPNQPREAEISTAVSNAYAFAGNTSAVVLKRFS